MTLLCEHLNRLQVTSIASHLTAILQSKGAPASHALQQLHLRGFLFRALLGVHGLTLVAKSLALHYEIQTLSRPSTSEAISASHLLFRSLAIFSAAQAGGSVACALLKCSRCIRKKIYHVRTRCIYSLLLVFVQGSGIQQACQGVQNLRGRMLTCSRNSAPRLCALSAYCHGFCGRTQNDMFKTPKLYLSV